MIPILLFKVVTQLVSWNFFCSWWCDNLKFSLPLQESVLDCLMLSVKVLGLYLRIIHCYIIYVRWVDTSYFSWQGVANSLQQKLKECHAAYCLFLFTESTSIAVTNTTAIGSSRNHQSVKAGLNIWELFFCIISRLTKSAHKFYNTAINQYKSFCNTISNTCTVITEYTLLLFITHLGQKQLAYSTIKVYLAAI